MKLGKREKIVLGIAVPVLVAAILYFLVLAPYVDEFPLVLECKLLHTFELGLHTQFVGQILDVKADETVLDDGGAPIIEKVRPLVFAPSNRTYYGVGELVGKAFSIGKEI